MVHIFRFTGSSAVETICMTVADYYNDHKHLRPHIRCALLMEIQYKIVGEYMIGIDSRSGFWNFIGFISENVT